LEKRDVVNDYVLDRLEYSETPEICLDAMYGGEKRVDFKYKKKKYTHYYGQWSGIESLELLPKFGEIRNILGVPWRLAGIDYSYLPWARRVVWSLWSGTPTKTQADKIWHFASHKKNDV
jgi:hypothetical protein